MKESEYSKIIELVYKGGGFIPNNSAAFELAQNCGIGEILEFSEVTKRDVKFHRGYFSLLNYIYGMLPQKFQQSVPVNKFYHFIKHLKGEYEIIFEFKDGTKMVEYESISFGRMSQKKFEEYVKNQLPYIYENIIGLFYSGEQFDMVIESIETEFEKYLSKL